MTFLIQITSAQQQLNMIDILSSNIFYFINNHYIFRVFNELKLPVSVV